MPTTPYVTSPADGYPHVHSSNSSITWSMGTITHYSSKVTIGTVAGWSDIYAGKEIVNSAASVTDNTVPTPGGGQSLYTKVQYRATKNGIWRNGGTITSFVCN